MKYLLLALFFISHANDCFAENANVQGVSIVNLLANPKGFDDKFIQTNGYIIIHGDGPTKGYWLSLFKEFDIYSSIKIDVPEDAPLRRWVKSEKFYTVSGIFNSCDTLACTPIIIFDENRPYIIR